MLKTKENKQNKITLRYQFQYREHFFKILSIDLDQTLLTHDLNDFKSYKADKSPMTRLDFHQCSHCPLSKEEFAHCPLAYSYFSYFDEFDLPSEETKCSVSVWGSERVYFKETEIKNALASFTGLLMASSHCPQINFLRPLIRFHLPFNTSMENTFRSLSLFLLHDYFKKGEKLDPQFILSEMEQYYNQLEEINEQMINRFKVGVFSAVKLEALSFFKDLSLALKNLKKDWPKASQELQKIYDQV